MFVDGNRMGWLALCALTLVGCGGGGVPDQERLSKIMGGAVGEVVPVAGSVLVDGKPGERLWVMLYSADGTTPVAAGGRAVTDPTGKFAFTTYGGGDGLKPGEYKVVIVGQHYNKKAGFFEGPDSLNGRYSDPKSSTFSLNVKSGAPQKDLKFELTSK